MSKSRERYKGKHDEERREAFFRDGVKLSEDGEPVPRTEAVVLQLLGDWDALDDIH